MREGARVSDHYLTRSPVTGEEYVPMRAPRFTEIPTFMRAPLAESLEGLDIALVGVPFDGGVSNRSGSHAPQALAHLPRRCPVRRR